MNADQAGQVTRSAAEVYEEFFVPALFAQWAGRVADAAGIQPGQRVLDVACGTGVLARTAAERVGRSGSVVGVDINEEMLAVARRTAPDIDWRQARAEALPFADGEFDAVISQFGLMFFEDRAAALREMARVLRPGGHLVIAVWDALENGRGYPELTDLLQRICGDEAAAALRAPFSLGEPGALAGLVARAGIADARIHRQPGAVHFPSLDAWLFTEIKGWVLADQVDDALFRQLLEEAAEVLKPLVRPDGTVVLKVPALLATATRPAPGDAWPWGSVPAAPLPSA